MEDSMASSKTILFALALLPALAAAQAPAKVTIPAAAVGTWDFKSMTGPKDSVITTAVMTMTADGKGTTQFPNRPLLTGRVIAAGGDSVVTELGPYESILKKGLQATTRTTSHYKGNTMWGTFEAKYSDGSVVKGKTTGTKKTK
jgi:hypothetical protein